MKCGIAAHELEKEQASRNISRKVKEYAAEHQSEGFASLAMFLGEKVKNEEFKLHEKSRQGQIFTFVKAYNSSECLDIHEEDRIIMPLTYYLAYLFI